jgi:hypothetical protein
MHLASGGTDGQITAAWITAGLALAAAVANIIVTLRTRASDRSQRQRERSQDQEVRRQERDEDVASQRRDRAEAQQRETYASFVQAVEELVARLRPHIDVGAIAEHVEDLKIRDQVRAAAAEAGQAVNVEDVPVSDNPIPNLSDPEPDVLKSLDIRARTWRVMVEIVGPHKVAIAATKYQDNLHTTTLQLIDRDPKVGKSFEDSAGSREQFVDAARAALDPTAG